MDRARAQSYDSLADHYELLSGAGPDRVVEWLPTVLPDSGYTALDLGCGAGRHAVLLADRFDQVHAIDISPAMIELAEQTRPNPAVTYKVADLFDVDGCYDLVFSSAMLHHVDDLSVALRHVGSLIAKGGTAVLVDVIAPDSPGLRLAHRISSRSVYRASALLHLIGAVTRGDRGGLERYRLMTYRPWLDHLVTDRFLTAAEFDATYKSNFPGAETVDLGFLRACVWSAADRDRLCSTCP